MTPGVMSEAPPMIASLGLAGVVVIGVGISQGLRNCPPSERN